MIYSYEKKANVTHTDLYNTSLFMEPFEWLKVIHIKDRNTYLIWVSPIRDVRVRNNLSSSFTEEVLDELHMKLGISVANVYGWEFRNDLAITRGEYEIIETSSPHLINRAKCDLKDLHDL